MEEGFYRQNLKHFKAERNYRQSLSINDNNEQRKIGKRKNFLQISDYENG